MKHRLLSRVSAAVFCAAAVISLSACGSGSSGKLTTKATEPAAPPTVSVTIPEGSCCVQAAAILEESGVCSSESFLAAVNNEENLALIPWELEEKEERPFLLEGYVFPDTYEFYTGRDGQYALERILENTKVKITPVMAERAGELDYSIDEILSIASIIQEEAGHAKDMPYVSSVIHNRLDSPDYPYIQCDVSIRYLEDQVKPFFTEDEYSRICDFYNINSKRKGLPAGPITNPGLDAINAALEPPESDYYFFVTDEEENYYFAETYSEHRENCKKAGIGGDY